MGKSVKVCIIVIVSLVVIIVLFRTAINTSRVPANYIDHVETGGELEAHYLKMGKYEVAHLEKNFPETFPDKWSKYVIYYPKELEQNKQQYPVVIFANGTGVGASKYSEMFEHLGSWGFIVLGNEDPETATGESIDTTLSILLNENKDKESIFFGKVDVESIGICGHSQGGVAVFNSISSQEHSNMYKCAVTLSPSDEANSAKQGRAYDSSKTTIPIMIFAGTEYDAISLENMKSMYQKIDAHKIIGRKTGMGHGEMLYSADGYVTAWFMWQLQNDQNAANAFIGENPEIFRNELYQDQQSNLH